MILQQLSVTKNGEAQEPLALTLTGGIYGAELQVPNENATYVFAVSVAESDYYAAADTSVTVLTARCSSGGGGHADPAPEVLNHTPYLLGYDDGTFRPEGNITRAQVAAIFARLLSEQTGNPNRFGESLCRCPGRCMVRRQRQQHAGAGYSHWPQ